MRSESWRPCRCARLIATLTSVRRYWLNCKAKASRQRLFASLLPGIGELALSLSCMHGFHALIRIRPHAPHRMFKGLTSEGINREVSGILECARMNREHDLQSLAIPETSLVFLAKENIAKHQQASNADESRALFSIGKSRHQTPTEASEPDAKTVLRGILPSLQYVVNRHKSSVIGSEEAAHETKRMNNGRCCVSIDSKPDTWQDPE